MFCRLGEGLQSLSLTSVRVECSFSPRLVYSVDGYLRLALGGRGLSHVGQANDLPDRLPVFLNPALGPADLKMVLSMPDVDDGLSMLSLLKKPLWDYFRCISFVGG